MVGLWRHAFAVVVLPVTVAILVPIWLARRFGVSLTFPDSFMGSLGVAAGIACLGVGLTLFADCLRRFAREGQGTLAPWDPPRELVVTGAYRWVRNPMISGVICVLVGEALFLRSVPHLVWAFVFTGMNAVYIPLVEEPGLEQRFGESYRRYCQHVPRVFPRLTPWNG